MFDWLMSLLFAEVRTSIQEENEAWRRSRDPQPRRVIDPTTMSEQEFSQAIRGLRHNPCPRRTP